MFSKEKVKAIRDEVRIAVKEIADRHGVKLGKNNASYSDLELNLRISFSTVSESGETKEALDFKKYARSYGMKPEALGMSFTRGAYTFTVVGLFVKKSKNIVKLERNDGKTFMSTVSSVVMNIPEANAEASEVGDFVTRLDKL